MNLLERGQIFAPWFTDRRCNFSDRSSRRFPRKAGSMLRFARASEYACPCCYKSIDSHQGATNPQVGESGECEDSCLLDLRNTPGCPRYVALTPPSGCTESLSVTQATDEFGVAAERNSGSATIEDWWADDFVQSLATESLARHAWKNDGARASALRLIENAVRAANDADRHSAMRIQAWNVLSRVFSISDPNTSFESQLSLATGVPHCADGSLDADDQIKVLGQLADAMVDRGFRSCIDGLKLEADEADKGALDAFLAHMESTCRIPPALNNAAAFYYSPTHGDHLDKPPTWWLALTLERWIELLQEERQPDGALWITCTNSLIPKMRGITALVTGAVELSIGLPDDVPGPADAVVNRASGGAANARQWSRRLPDEATISDTDIPTHRRAIRYTAECAGLRKANVKVVSLNAWAPGVFVFCRTATKIQAPKRLATMRDGITMECSITLAGQGRHYVDLHVRDGVSVGSPAIGYDARGQMELEAKAPISAVSHQLFGLEINATAECYYDVPVTLPNDEPHILRLNVSCDETTAEGSRSEFERLIRLNRQQGLARATMDVQVDRQLRSAVLEGWILECASSDRSLFPVVLAPDCANAWRTPDWRIISDSVLSTGRFLLDPRPALEEMNPPRDFREARAVIASRIRGESDEGLVETARLGEWLAEPEWAETIDRYLQSYLAWLDAEPDTAAWCDLVIVSGLESDGQTLMQEPDAVLVSPLHPIRIAWHSLAQRALFQAYQSHSSCPAASILDPDTRARYSPPLPMRTAAGSVRRQVFLSVRMVVRTTGEYSGTDRNG